MRAVADRAEPLRTPAQVAAFLAGWAPPRREPQLDRTYGGLFAVVVSNGRTIYRDDTIACGHCGLARRESVMPRHNRSQLCRRGEVARLRAAVPPESLAHLWALQTRGAVLRVGILRSLVYRPRLWVGVIDEPGRSWSWEQWLVDRRVGAARLALVTLGWRDHPGHRALSFGAGPGPIALGRAGSNAERRA